MLRNRLAVFQVRAITGPLLEDLHVVLKSVAFPRYYYEGMQCLGKFRGIGSCILTPFR
jgi:hypothetical protein